MGFIAILGIFALVTFLIAVIARRAYLTIAFVVGSIPAATVAVENVPGLINPLSWLVLAQIWTVCVAGSLVGAWLARLVHRPWRSA